jgi:sugar phosphate isomerase/epimerase
MPECRTDACFDQFIRNVVPIVEMAEGFGVVLGIEPVVSHSIYDAKRARKMLDTLQSPNVRIIFDPVNLLNAENAMKHRDVFAEFIDLLGDEIAVLHLKDFIFDENGFRTVAAGFGEMDFSQIASFVQKFKPHIHATLENTTPENAVEALSIVSSMS